jgi:hypothetical protein
MTEVPGEFAHTDRNRLVRVSAAATAEVAATEM